MHDPWVLLILLVYLALIYGLSLYRGRTGKGGAFYVGDRKSPWGLISLGMIGTSLSGVSLLSIPGWVGATGMSYLQMVLGYVVGYYAVAYLLLPVFYRLGSPSIYAYLGHRFGRTSQRTGAGLFIIARSVVASFRLFVVVGVLHSLLLSQWGFPFWVSAVLAVGLIWSYTRRAGMQVLIWTDAVQTVVMLACVVASVWYLCQALGLSPRTALRAIGGHELGWIFEWGDWSSPQHFAKQFVAGALLPIAMTGLDQDMMQKNLGCRTLRAAQRNMVTYGWSFVPINLLLLGLGVLLTMYAEMRNLCPTPSGDALYATIATGGTLPPIVSVLFVLGVASAALSSADSALTSLTTSFVVDILGPRGGRLRALVHTAMGGLILGLVLLFSTRGTGSAIGMLLTAASYLYGPLLGLYALGLCTRARPRERFVPLILASAPLLTGGIGLTLAWTTGYSLGYESLLLNGAISFGGLWLARDVKKNTSAA